MIIKLKSEQKGEHIHETVFIGPDKDHLARCGTLVMSKPEWFKFGRTLGVGAKVGDFYRSFGIPNNVDDVDVLYEGDEEILQKINLN